ncbi:MAG TPA: PKD-like domain-containing protein, partial [Hanamia sp.]|nr:PKD-like domain-containing protein [Hanamia sp.]
MRKLYLFILRSLCRLLLILRQEGVSYAIIFLISGTVFCSEASAQVSITAPSLTVSTCGTFPTNFAALGDIVITETSNSNFASATGQTLILSAPANFEFQAGQGSVSYISGNNISSATVAVTTNTITVTYSVSNTNRADQLTISGIMVRGITGVATNQTVTRTGGTGTISGDVNGTVHATFSSQILPTPSVTTTTTQTSCSGSATAIALTGSPSGASFSWTTANINNVTGATSGSGSSIVQTLTSSGSPGTVDYIVTPTLNGCAGSSTTITNTVNPKATVNAVSNQVVCNNSSTSAVSFSSPTTGGTITYNWVNNTPSIGLAASGSGNIPSFTATNNSNAPITATITVTPAYSNAGVSCTGTSSTFTITVNPTAAMSGITDQFVCVNTSALATTFNS